MTERLPISVQRPIWIDAQQVDETDLNSEQQASDAISSAIINNQFGYGIIPNNLVSNVIFDSSQSVGYLDGLAISAQHQPSDPNFGNQLSITLVNSAASGTRQVKVCIIGLDFNDDLQYETFYFHYNETQIGSQHFTQVLAILFNDLVGNPTVSFNLGGTLTITEAQPMTLSRDAKMIAQDQQPSLFFRDFFLDPASGYTTVQSMLTAALPDFNIAQLNIYTQPADILALVAGDVTTQLGQKFQATTNNIQKVTLLLSVQNTVAPYGLDWTGDLIISVYPLQTTLSSNTDLVPSSAIGYSPSNIPLAQISYNYTTLQAIGIQLDSVPQPVDFIFSNSPIANGNVIADGQYYVVSIKRSGAANLCDILVSVGQDLLGANSILTTFSPNGNLWVDIPTENLWFQIWTDAAKISDGQAYDTGHGVVIPKTTVDPITQATIDYSLGAQQFAGNDTFYAVLSAATQTSAPVPDQRTGDEIASRQQYVPQVSLLDTIAITNLEKASEPLILGSISDKNIKTFVPSLATINSVLFSATMVQDELLIRVVDDPTDTLRFNTEVSGLITDLLNGNLVGATITPDPSSPSSPSYRIANAVLSSMILGDVDGDGVITDNDVTLLNSLIGYNLNTGLQTHSTTSTTIISGDGYTTFANGYVSLTQSFVSAFGLTYQFIRSSDGYVFGSGSDGVLVSNPTVNSQCNFTSASVDFNSFLGLSSYTLVITANSGLNPIEANWGGWEIVGITGSGNGVLTLQKIYLTSETMGQILRADIDGDFAVTSSDGYLINSYISRYQNPVIPAPFYPAPTSNAYDKIGTRFNVISLRLEELVDRSDDYTPDPNTRAISLHPVQDIFLNDGYFASHNYITQQVNFTITEQLIWDDALVVSNSQSKLMPTVFTAETGFIQNPCSIIGTQTNTYPVPQEFDPGVLNFFVPNNLIIGNGGQLQQPDGYFYKVDFEVGTIVLEIPDGLFGAEYAVDLMNDFVIDYTGDGITRLGFPSMRFADCSFVNALALDNDQVRFSVAMQSFSPNTNGLSTDGYYGAIVDGKMGVNIDYSTGILTINFTNLYQDQIFQTLSTKVQVSVYLKKGGFNNQTLFVDSAKIQNMLNLVSVFSGANEGGSGIGGFIAGGDLSGTSTNQTVIGLQTNPIKIQLLGSAQDGYVLTWNNTDHEWEAEPAAGGASLDTTLRVSNANITITNGTTNIIAGFLGLTANQTGTLFATPSAGQKITFKDKDGSLASFNFTINGNGKNIDGTSTFVMNSSNVGAFGSITLYYDGTDWGII